MALAAGQVVAGKYRIERELGSGGMGTVYVATNVVLQKHVALKVMHREGRPPRPEDAERFLREGVAASRVRHPGIVEVFDAGVDAGPGGEVGLPWMAMELLEGESLQDLLDRRRTLPVAEAVGILTGVLSALAAVHERGIVHRDLKPANVFLAALPGGGVQPKLLDFGIAKLKDRTQLTASGSMLGTANFMAPEQLVDAGSADARADLYAIGAMLYLCLAGVPPFEASSIFELLSKVQIGEPRDLRTLAPHLPAGLARVIHWCLAADPAERPQSAPQLAAALAGAGAPEGAAPGATGAPAPSASAAPELAPTLAAPAATYPAPAPAPASRRRSPWVLIAVLGTVIVAAPTVLGLLIVVAVFVINFGPTAGGSVAGGGGRTQWNSVKRPLLVDVTDDGVTDVVGCVRQVVRPDMTSHVGAFDGRTGERLWLTPPLGDEEAVVTSLVAAAGGVLVVVDQTATVRAFSLADGTPSWTAMLPERAQAICAGDARHVVLSLADGAAFGLGLGDGSLWPVPAPAGGENCANRIDDSLLRSITSPTAGRRMTAVDAETFSIPGMRAEAAWVEAGGATAVVVGTRDQGSRAPTIAAVQAGRALWAHDVSSGNRFQAENDLPDAVALGGQRVVVAYALLNDLRRVASLDLATGRVLWDVEVPDSDHGVAALETEGGRVFVSHWCWLEVLDAETGARRFRIGRWY